MKNILKDVEVLTTQATMLTCNICRKEYRDVREGHYFSSGICLRCKKIYESFKKIIPSVHLFTEKENIKNQDKALRQALEFIGDSAENDSKWLFIFGKSGTGKSMIASLILKKLIKGFYQQKSLSESDREYRCLASWQNVPGLTMRLRSTMQGYKGETEKDIVDAIIRYQYLVLDDLGADSSTDFSASSLYTLINYRWEDNNPKKRTIITSNLTISQISERLGPRVADRILRNSIKIETEGNSFNLNKS